MPNGFILFAHLVHELHGPFQIEFPFEIPHVMQNLPKQYRAFQNEILFDQKKTGDDNYTEVLLKQALSGQDINFAFNLDGGTESGCRLGATADGGLVMEEDDNTNNAPSHKMKSRRL